MTSRPPYCIPKQYEGGNVNVGVLNDLNQSLRLTWELNLFLLYKQFLQFHYICQAAGHVSKNDLFGEIGAYKVERGLEGS